MQKLMLKKWQNNFLLLVLMLTINSLWAQSTDRIIVKFKNNKHSTLIAHISSDRMAKMQRRVNTSLRFKRQMLDGASVFLLDKETAINDVKAYAALLSNQNDIEYAEPDYRKFPSSFSSEARFNEQWYLHNATSVKVSALNMVDAWAIEDGSTNPTIVAIIDSGYLPNTPDLDNQYVGGNANNGYDFISQDDNGVFVTANDGSGRDNTPEDAGDGFTVAEFQAEVSRSGSSSNNLLSCSGIITQNENNSWHGIFVAGIVASQSNGTGIVGVNPNAKILPLRVLGRCGGYTSDIADAIRWAAGLTVSGVGANTNVAKVINLSLGSLNACTFSEQLAINAAFSAGSVLMVAAGNEGTAVSNSSPANCGNVMTVSAVTQGGAETNYTNFGEAIDISAPGGSGFFDATKILSLSNDGLQVKGNATFKAEVGTSFSTPMVAGVASLMLSINPSLTPSQIMGTLKATSRAFPNGTSGGARDCSVANCGEGMLNAEAALIAVRDNNLTADYNNISSGNDPTEPLTTTTSSGNVSLYFIGWLWFLLTIRKLQKKA